MQQPSQINFNNHFILRGEKKKVEGGGGGVYTDSKEEDAFAGAEIAGKVKIPPFFELKATAKRGSGSVRPKSRSGRLEEGTCGGVYLKDGYGSFVGNSRMGILSGVEAVVSGTKMLHTAASEASSSESAVARLSTLPPSTLVPDDGYVQDDT